MPELAQKYADKLKEKMLSIWFNDKYKYWNADIYFQDFEVDKDTWNRHQYVCVNSQGEVTGYIGYCINRRADNCHSLNAINFGQENSDTIRFGDSLYRVIRDIFEKFKFNKLNFSVIVGNPIEASYDKLIEKYGGRIVGYFKNEVKLYDGQYCDEKLYEITREQYLESMKKDG